MAIERRQPLPVGRYWVVITGSNRDLFNGWVKSQRGVLFVDATVDHPDFKPPVSWYLFHTTGPVVWPQVFGFPNIAGPNVHSEQDTIQADLPENPLDQLGNALPSIQQLTLGLEVAAVVIGLVGLYIVLKRK